MRTVYIHIFLFFLGSLDGFSQTIEEIAASRPSHLINDFAHVLDPSQERALEEMLVQYDDSTSNQIAVVTIRTLGDNWEIEEAALKIFRDWGIGNKKTNNGVLILAVIDDRKIRIEVGYGLEGAIPDITATQIIRSDIVPNFREGNYYEGLVQASGSLIKAAAGEYRAPEGYRDRDKGGGNVIGLVIFFIIMLLILSNIRRGGGGGFMNRRGYRNFGPPVFWPGGGGGWSGGSGGGFGGFGGGSGGGGGSSGNW